jgi:hypothetical protein
MTSHCMNCGEDKGSNFHANYCDTCTAAMEGAAADALAKGNDVSDARRTALAERAHTAHRNFKDPRGINRKSDWLYGNLPPELRPNEGAPNK